MTTRGRGGAHHPQGPEDRFPAIAPPEATYSGHKGKGYEVQVAETCHAENATQLITHVEVTPSSGSDTDVTVPLVDGLAERKVRPGALRGHGVSRAATPSRPRAGGRNW